MSGYRGGGGGWTGFAQYMKDKTVKLSDQFDQRYSRKSVIFEGMTFWSTGRMEDVNFDLRKLITENGGVYEQYGLRCVSHIVASNVALSNQNWKKLLGGKFAKMPFKLVTPQWITHSIEAGKTLPESEFLPECLRMKDSIERYFEVDENAKNGKELSMSDVSEVESPYIESMKEIDSRVMRINYDHPSNSVTVTEELCCECLKLPLPLKRKGNLNIVSSGTVSVFNLNFNDSGTSLAEALFEELREKDWDGVTKVSLSLYEDTTQCGTLSIFPSRRETSPDSIHAVVTSLSGLLCNSDEDTVKANLLLIMKTSGIFAETILMDSFTKLVKSRKLDVAAGLAMHVQKIASNTKETAVIQWIERFSAKALLAFSIENNGASLLSS